MAPKRLLPAPEDVGEPSRPQKRWRSLVLEIRNEQFTRLFLARMDSMIRRVVPEEVGKALCNHFNPPPPRLLLNRNQQPRYRIVFLNNLSLVYTMNRLKGENGMALKVAILDTIQNKMIMFGHLSKVKVEIVVLHGNFNARKEDNWSAEEFNRHIVRERDRNGQLLTGDLILRLENGEASLDNATFRDNSSFTSTKTFRLGARLLSDIGERVLEGITRPFPVKERRLESSEKHYPPLLDDKVWRLERIAKNGPYHKTLENNGIETVQDFLKSYVMDEQKLQGIFKKMSEWTWKAITDHAMRCDPGDDLYSYCIAEKNFVLFFNSIYQLIGAKFDSRYKELNHLDPLQKDAVEKLKPVAYENMKSVQYDHKMVDYFPVPLHTIDGSTFFPGSSSSQLHLSAHQAAVYGQEAIQSGQQQPASSPRENTSIGQEFGTSVQSHNFEENSLASLETSKPDAYESTNCIQPQHQMTSNLVPIYSDDSNAVPQSRLPQFHPSDHQMTHFGQVAVPDGQHQFISAGDEVDHGVYQGGFSSGTVSEWWEQSNFHQAPSNDVTFVRDDLSFPDTMAGIYDLSPYEERLWHFAPPVLSTDSEQRMAVPPVSPRRWVKIKAAVKWVSVTRLSTRQRLVPTM